MLLNVPIFCEDQTDSVWTSSVLFLEQQAEALEVFPHENPLGVVHKLRNRDSRIGRGREMITVLLGGVGLAKWLKYYMITVYYDFGGNAVHNEYHLCGFDSKANFFFMQA